MGGHGLDSRWGHLIFQLPNPSSRNMALWFTQRLTEMSTRNLPVGKERPALKTDNLITISEPIA
jgi:hypothetical protein